MLQYSIFDSEIGTEGLLCMADLFPVSSSDVSDLGQSIRSFTPTMSQWAYQKLPGSVVGATSHQNYIIRENTHSDVRNALVGSLVVEACCIDYKGKKALVFVFSVCIAFGVELETML